MKSCEAAAGEPGGAQCGNHVVFYGPLAQLVEQGTFNPLVVGSSPTGPIVVLVQECQIFSQGGFCANALVGDVVFYFDYAVVATADRLRREQIANNVRFKTGAASATGATATLHYVPRGEVVEV